MRESRAESRAAPDRSGVESQVETPAYIFDEATLVADATEARDETSRAGAHLLFAMKSCAFPAALGRISEYVDGLHASSLFEARLARDILGPAGAVHVTTPAIAASEIDALCALSDMISFNSLPQWDRFRASCPDGAKPGLRVNPELSLVRDERYDPCRRHSKLGVPLSDLREVVATDPERFDGLAGLLIHTNAESQDFRELLGTIRHLDRTLSPLLDRIEWINLGGGYLFRGGPYAPLQEAVGLLRSKYGLRVYMEPGTSIIQRAGRLVATVVDVFASGGATVAVLDASVNHLPEAFEFQFEPPVEGDQKTGGHPYILAGATCLAGDVFGEYAFAEPLRPGARVVVKDVGAYSMVKAHMFNGVNLPSVYWQGADGRCTLSKRYEYEDFISRCGG